MNLWLGTLGTGADEVRQACFYDIVDGNKGYVQLSVLTNLWGQMFPQRLWEQTAWCFNRKLTR